MSYYKKCIDLFNINNITCNNLKKYILQPYYFPIILLLFLLSSVATTLLAQFIAYQGAANEFSMFLVFIEYLGMLSVWILHDFFAKRYERRRSTIRFTPIASRVNYDYSNELQNVVVVDNEVINSTNNPSSPTISSFGILSDIESNTSNNDEPDKEYHIINELSLSPLVTTSPRATRSQSNSKSNHVISSTDTMKVTVKTLSRAPSSNPSRAPSRSPSNTTNIDESKSSNVQNEVQTALANIISPVPVTASSNLNPFNLNISREIFLYLVLLIGVDLLAAFFSIFGLVWSGSAIFSVVNSSALVATAVFTWLFTSTPLSRAKMIPIIIVTFGLVLSGIRAFSATPDVEEEQLVVSASGAVRVEESSVFQGSTRMIAGILISFLSTLLYSLEYVIAERILSKSSMKAASLVGYIGLSGVIFSLIYIFAYTVPHWHEIVSEEIIKNNGKALTIFFLYFLFLIAEAVYNYTYFVIIETSGAVTGGVMQGLRAVLVFSMSAVLFCDVKQSQCFDTIKGISAFIVIGGVMIYALVSRLEDSSKTQTQTVIVAEESSSRV